MKEIKLTNSFKVALVDDEDFDYLSKFTWNLGSDGRHPQARVNGTTVEMHSLLLTDPTAEMVDHKDRDGLNNQKENLRYSSRSENYSNREKYKSNTSGYKGVSWHKGVQRWMAAIQVNRRRKHLGYFFTPEDAALAYNEAAKKYHGEFAVLNKIAD